MSDVCSRVQALQKSLQDHFSEIGSGAALSNAQRNSLEALKERCQKASCTVSRHQPLRTLHHFACTGGTLIAKALASMPNTVVLSEIDPLSKMQFKGPKPNFCPTDLTPGLRYSAREIGDDTILGMFESAVVRLRDELDHKGLYLVMRDHAHSQYCTIQDPHARPNLHQIVSQIAPVKGLVTVRHPLDSFLSLTKNGWIHFSPGTIEEYCRRYLVFLMAHENLPLMKYEDFVAEPQSIAKTMCDHLDLAFDPDFEFLIPLARLTGDSGRSSSTITPRPRAPVPDDIRQGADRSQAYAALCERLDYDP